MRLYIQKIEGKFEVGIDTTQEQYEEFNELQGICDRLNSENKEEVKEKKLGAKKDFGIIKQSLADSLKEYLSHKDTKGKKAVIKVIDAICGEKEKKSKVKPKVHGCGSLGDFSACGKNGITTTSTADVTCKLCLRAMKARGIL